MSSKEFPQIASWGVGYALPQAMEHTDHVYKREALVLLASYGARNACGTLTPVKELVNPCASISVRKDV